MDFRQRLEQNRSRSQNDFAAEPDEQFSCPYFATARNGLPPYLDLRFKDGTRKAFPYALFGELGFDPERGIKLLSVSKEVSITGRNLSKLFDYLIANKVRYIQEDVGRDAEEDGVFVSEIIIEDHIS